LRGCGKKRELRVGRRTKVFAQALCVSAADECVEYGIVIRVKRRRFWRIAMRKCGGSPAGVAPCF